MRRAATTATLALGLGLLAGCAAFDPYVRVGPEDRYRGSDAALPPTVRAVSLDEALRLLESRRGEMMRKARELTWLSSGSRLVAAGGVGTGVGGLLFNANGTLIAASALTAGGAYLVGQGFAPATARLVYLAGAQALSCVERQATAAVAAPPPDPTLLDPAQAALAALEAAIGEAQAAGVDGARVAEAAALRRQLDELLGQVGTGVASSPALAAAVGARTQDIALQTNRELEKAIPDIGAILSLAQGVGSVAMGAIAGGARGVGQERVAAPAGGRFGATAQDPERTAAAARLDRAVARARAADLALRHQVAARQQAAVAAVGACAFEAPGGQAVALSVPSPAPLAPGSALAVAVSGGRGPYRISPTGTTVPGLAAAPEYTAQDFTVSAARTVARGATATWLVQDAGNPQAKPATLTVTVPAAPP